MNRNRIGKKGGRVFISYRHVEPDQHIAKEIFDDLETKYEVFIDQTMSVGTKWGETIQEHLETTDVLIALLSPEYVRSEMCIAEIETVRRLFKKSTGLPAILPIRVNFHEPLGYPLSAYLNSINYISWNGEGDTSRILEELTNSISDILQQRRTKINSQSQEPASSSLALPPLPAAQPILRPTNLRLEAPEGTMDNQSAFYITRSADTIAIEAIQEEGVTVTIKGPRQVGKSSLLNRVMGSAVERGKRVVFIDFQLFDQDALSNPTVFFRQFSDLISEDLGLVSHVDNYWQRPLGNIQRSSSYMQNYILKEVGVPLTLALDEVERIFGTNFRNDFFSMLRTWHNNRGIRPQIWKSLDIALVTSTEPYQLIADLNQSPFNVGHVIELEDFTAEQVSELNRRHGSPLNLTDESNLIDLLHGQPYLIRKAIYLVACHRISISDLFAKAVDEQGPFGDHLRYHLYRLHGSGLVENLMQVIENHACQDETAFFRLRGAGLVRREGRTVVPRCQLYADFFRSRLHV